MPFSFVGGVGGAIRGFREGAFGSGLISDGVNQGANEERWDLYRRNWAFYRNTAFENLDAWASYMEERGLYEETRCIYNPLKRLTEFYVGRIYPGRISVDGRELPYAVRNAIPMSDNVSEGLKRACAQVMEWSRWQTAKSPWIRQTAVMGQSLLELVDDVEAGRVRMKVWPATVLKDFERNDAGYLEMYHLQYPAIDDEGEPYVYGRRVTRTLVTVYRDEEIVGETPINYGFVPSVLCFHKDIGDDFGADVFDGDYVKLEELNSIATHGLDNLHKNIDPAVIAWTDTRIVDALKKSNDPGMAGEFTADGSPYSARRDFRLLKGGTGGSLEPLVGRLVSNELVTVLQEITGQIEKDHPELVYFDKLREMQYVSGPGARALIGDTESNYMEACANYDENLQRALEMAVAIGGQRLKQRDGGWANQSEKQKNLAGFDLDSYAKDQLNVEIMTRPLLPWTIDDETAVKKARAEVAVMVGPFTSKEFQMEEFGIEEQAARDKILKQGEEEAQKAAARAMAVVQSKPTPRGTDPNMTGNQNPTKKEAQTGGKPAK